MHIRAITGVTGTLVLVTGLAMVFPVLCSLWYGGEGDLAALASSAGLAVVVGLVLRSLSGRNPQLSTRDAFLVSTLGWVIVSAISALPFVIHGSIPSFTDAFFEMMSGYTTTGSTILTDVEVVPHGLLFWRSETHLIGGMGFLTVAILTLPHGIAGLRIFRAEASPGQVITGERFTARNRDAVVHLWMLYLALNLAEVILLCAGGMTPFDSLCHAFGTVSTSGYSTHNAGIGYFDSAYIDWVIIVFMALGGTSFVLLLRVARGEWRVLTINTELRWYIGLTGSLCLLVALALWLAGIYDPVDALRFGTFQVVSLLTTTGFTTADYELWPRAAQMFLVAACLIGACAGSTGSGIKIVHFAIIWKFVVSTIKKLTFQPLTVVSVRLDGLPVDRSIIDLAMCYFVVNIVVIIGGACCLVVVDDLDHGSAMSAVVATLMNIGPGFGSVGPTDNFAHISALGKWFLSLNMLVGRLDLFSVLVLLYPSFWRR